MLQCVLSQGGHACLGLPNFLPYYQMLDEGGGGLSP